MLGIVFKKKTANLKAEDHIVDKVKEELNERNAIEWCLERRCWRNTAFFGV